MLNLNKVLLLGNVSRVECQMTVSGIVTFLSIATTNRFLGPSGEICDETCWHNIVCYNKQAEIARKFATKGDTVLIDGRIRNRKYTDALGATRVKNEIICDRLAVFVPKGIEEDGKPAPTVKDDGPVYMTDIDKPF